MMIKRILDKGNDGMAEAWITGFRSISLKNIAIREISKSWILTPDCAENRICEKMRLDR